MTLDRVETGCEMRWWEVVEIHGRVADHPGWDRHRDGLAADIGRGREREREKKKGGMVAAMVV